MSSNNMERLNQLKVGSVLTKRKTNGDKYSRHFYLDEHENFISYYQSDKIFAQPRRCKFCSRYDLSNILFL